MKSEPTERLSTAPNRKHTRTRRASEGGREWVAAPGWLASVARAFGLKLPLTRPSSATPTRAGPGSHINATCHRGWPRVGRGAGMRFRRSRVGLKLPLTRPSSATPTRAGPESHINPTRQRGSPRVNRGAAVRFPRLHVGLVLAPNGLPKLPIFPQASSRLQGVSSPSIQPCLSV